MPLDYFLCERSPGKAYWGSKEISACRSEEAYSCFMPLRLLEGPFSEGIEGTSSCLRSCMPPFLHSLVNQYQRPDSFLAFSIYTSIDFMPSINN
jgi:hypothetical protein